MFVIEALDLILITTNTYTPSENKNEAPIFRELQEGMAEKSKQVNKYCVHSDHKCHVKSIEGY